MFPSFTNYIFYHTPVFYLIQSIWRDEAFSYFMSRPNIFKIITNTANDFNPPLYYIMFHFWILLVGKSDEALRLFSLIPHLLTVYLVYIFSKKLFSKAFSFFTALFFLVNPMLLYYAFEMRMYSWYALFFLCTLYFYYVKNWKWYTVFVVLGVYTHSFFLLVIIAFTVHLWISKKLKRESVVKTLKPLLFYIPWLPILVIQFLKSSNSWMFPVDLQLIKSVLGNLFTNFEGTPPNLWRFTFLLSIILIFFFYLAFKRKRRKALFFLNLVFTPLFLILGYSVFRRPIYTNRYLIFVSVSLIFSLSLGIWSLKNKTLRALVAAVWFGFAVYFNLFISPYHKKADFKKTFFEINKIASNTDYVYTKTPIAFLESAYYFKNENNVFVYNPNNISIPNYIGVNVIFPDISRNAFSAAPSKTFLVEDNANFDIIINK